AGRFGRSAPLTLETLLISISPVDTPLIDSDAMPVTPALVTAHESASPDPLVVAISSRALFDLEDSHALFERDGLEAYAAFQRAHEDELLAPGVAFPLVRKLLALNRSAPPEAPRVEVI